MSLTAGSGSHPGSSSRDPLNPLFSGEYQDKGKRDMQIKRFKIIRLLLLPMMWFAVGCSHFEPEPRNLMPENLPQTYNTPTMKKRVSAPDRWWESFGNPELSSLINHAISNNFSIREAWARLKQSGAFARELGSVLYPELGIEAGASHQRERSGDKTEQTGDSFRLGPAASYELDLWGKIRARATAGGLESTAGRFDLETVAMTVAAEVATQWTDLIAAREEHAMLEKQLEANTLLLKFLKLRFENGLSSALDVLQQQEGVNSTKSQFPGLETRIQQKRNAIALLLGKAPGQVPDILEKKLCDIPRLPETGLPADLVARRPDIRAAGMRLMAADWDTAAARADRLPNLTLNGSFLYNGTGLGSLLDNWILTLAGNLTAPIFDGGRREAALERAGYVAEERLAAYEHIVFTALTEVENALVAEKNQFRVISTLTSELDAAKLAQKEARKRYINGLDNFIPFISERINVQKLERQRIQQRAQLLIYRISLHRALGGSWTRELHTTH